MYRILSIFGFYLLGFNGVNGVCPGLLAGTPNLNETQDDPTIPSYDVYNAALPSLVIEDVFNDLYDLMLNSSECWPADTFIDEPVDSYAGLMLRLAWHCAGTFREDGVGGCAGGRQRYEMEASMDDNVNLDKARALLAPIKEKYGNALSWGDLFVFAGTAGILQGGGPVDAVCAGRVDDENGVESEPLFNSTTCQDPQFCQLPLGSTQIGLIYVDAAGFRGIPDPVATAPHIREIFARMDMNDWETVALIGGGHAFGKAHGACMEGAGEPPSVDPLNPWPGLCGQDFPQDAWTSGFEGQWTQYPFRWDNEYFTQLKSFILDNTTYVREDSPAGKPQWKNVNNGYFMLTTDIALIYDEDFKAIVKEYALNQTALDVVFASAWAKLVTSGGMMANNSFCVDGETLAPATTVGMIEPEMSTTMMMPQDDDDKAYRIGYAITFIIVSLLSFLIA